MPLFWLSLAFLSGIVLGKLLDWPGTNLAYPRLLSPWFCCPCVSYSNVSLPLHPPPVFLHSPLCIHPYTFLLPLPLLLVVLTPWGRGHVTSFPNLPSTPGFIAYYNDQEEQFVLEGLLTAPPDVHDTDQKLRFRLNGCIRWIINLPPWSTGCCWSALPTSGNWRYGDRIQLTGWLQTPATFRGFFLS